MKSNILKIALLALMFGAACFPLAAQAQDTDVVKSVRAAYAAAKEKIKLNATDEQTRNDADLVSRAEDYRALIPKFLDFSY